MVYNLGQVNFGDLGELSNLKREGVQTQMDDIQQKDIEVILKQHQDYQDKVISNMGKK
jgi:hypothetical protein